MGHINDRSSVSHEFHVRYVQKYTVRHELIFLELTEPELGIFSTGLSQ